MQDRRAGAEHPRSRRAETPTTARNCRRPGDWCLGLFLGLVWGLGASSPTAGWGYPCQTTYVPSPLAQRRPSEGTSSAQKDRHQNGIAKRASRCSFRMVRDHGAGSGCAAQVCRIAWVGSPSIDARKQTAIRRESPECSALPAARHHRPPQSRLEKPSSGWRESVPCGRVSPRRRRAGSLEEPLIGWPVRAWTPLAI